MSTLEELIRLCLENHVNLVISHISMNEVQVMIANPFSGKNMHFPISVDMLEDPKVLDDLKTLPKDMAKSVYLKSEEK